MKVSRPTRSEITVAIRNVARTGRDMNLPPPISDMPMTAFDPNSAHNSSSPHSCSLSCKTPAKETKKGRMNKHAKAITNPTSPTTVDGTSSAFGSGGNLFTVNLHETIHTIRLVELPVFAESQVATPPLSSESLLRPCPPGRRGSHPKNRRRSIAVGPCCGPRLRQRRGRDRRAR